MSLKPLFSLYGIQAYDLGDGQIILRTENATISISASMDVLNHPLTMLSFVADAPFTLQRMDATQDALQVYTEHPVWRQEKRDVPLAH